MKAELVRKKFGTTSTIGELLIDGEKVCLILEDKVRDLNKNGDNEEGKVFGQTAIPYGNYKIVLEPNGSIHQSYLKKDWDKLGFKGFKSVYKGMLMIVGIKGFSRVHIHIGNKISDSLGCPLTGTAANLTSDPYTVSGSTAAYVKLYKKVIDYLEQNTFIPLEVK
jgi:hypothetical protein